MRLSAPRIAPLADAEMDADQKDLVAPMAAQGRVLNIFRTLARTPKAARGFLAWGNYILSRRNDLPPRQRELVILRVGFLCRSGYEWTQHVEIGLRDGLSAQEISRIKQGPSAAEWTREDRLLLQATDELHHDRFISDATWSALRAAFTEKQCMDLVFTVGQYTQVSMILNTFGVPLDPGQTLDPDLKGY
ncbi:MAG: carboxymuconolactone decarboxylase family protein [Phenylobacterium sp.]